MITTFIAIKSLILQKVFIFKCPIKWKARHERPLQQLTTTKSTFTAHIIGLI